jgi:RNA polymerase sigma-70 factor, ECF subfamily
MQHYEQEMYRPMISNRRSNTPAGDVLCEQDFPELFERHWTPICQILFSLLGDWDDAQDLALDTFTQLAVNPPPSRHNLPGWLYRVATRLGFNKIRDYKRRKKYEELAGMEIESDNATSNPESDVMRFLEQQQVRKTLHALKPRSARLLLLRYSGLSYVEIANAMNIARGSIGTLLARAEKEFEMKYREQEELEDAKD